MSFLTDFPYILPLNRNLTEFDGFLTVKDRDIRVRISITDDKNVEIRGTWSDMQMLNSQEGFNHKKGQILALSALFSHDILRLKGDKTGAYEERMCLPFLATVSSLSDLSGILHELETIWEKELTKNKNDDTLLIAPAFYSSIVSQINDLNSENVEEISDDLKELKLVILDRSKRKHLVNVHFTDKFPDEKMRVSFTLPLNLVLDKSLTLRNLIEKFEGELERYQLFWDCMDKIDDNYCVLEPQNPTRKDRVRKIAINNKVSLTIIVDPKEPNKIPEFTFSGPDEEVIALDNLVSLKYTLCKPWPQMVIKAKGGLGYVSHNWVVLFRFIFGRHREEKTDNSMFPMTNFANILEVEFPGKKSETHEELLEPCAICYSYMLENAIPSESCSCKQRFHTKCLIEWLSSIPNARHTFNCYKGICPYCGQEITILEK